MVTIPVPKYLGTFEAVFLQIFSYLWTFKIALPEVAECQRAAWISLDLRVIPITILDPEIQIYLIFPNI